jgi:hypothetical protein
VNGPLYAAVQWLPADWNAMLGPCDGRVWVAGLA